MSRGTRGCRRCWLGTSSRTSTCRSAARRTAQARPTTPLPPRPFARADLPRVDYSQRLALLRAPSRRVSFAPCSLSAAGALFFMLTTQVMSSSASMRTFLAERAIAQHEARALRALSARLASLHAPRLLRTRPRCSQRRVSPPPSEPSRNLPLREARSALWAPLPYFLARSAAETLLQATAAAAFGAACYCLVGLAPTAAQFSFFLALVTLATLVAESYVVMVGTLLSDEKAAALVAPLLLALMMASGDASPRLLFAPSSRVASSVIGVQSESLACCYCCCRRLLRLARLDAAPLPRAQHRQPLPVRPSPDPSPCACLPPLPTASLRRQGPARSASAPTAPAPPPSGSQVRVRRPAAQRADGPLLPLHRARARRPAAAAARRPPRPPRRARPLAGQGLPHLHRRGGARAHGRLGPDAGRGVRRARAHGPRLPRRWVLGVASALPLAIGVASFGVGRSLSAGRRGVLRAPGAAGSGNRERV